MKIFVEDAKELYRFRWVIYSLVSFSLKNRYKKTTLGFFWSLLGPVLNYLMAGIIFSFLMKSMLPNYFLYLFSGVSIFNLISVTTNQSPQIMLVNEHYMRKIYIPKLVFVLNTVSIEFINFCLGVTALILLGALGGFLTLSWSYLFLPVPVLCTLLFNMGIACLFSVGTVFFRDLAHIVPILVQAMFYATPVLYSPAILPDKVRELLIYNPVFYFVESFRTPIYQQSMPSASIVMTMVLIAFSVLFLGLIVLKRYENEIIFRL